MTDTNQATPPPAQTEHSISANQVRVPDIDELDLYIKAKRSIASLVFVGAMLILLSPAAVLLLLALTRHNVLSESELPIAIVVIVLMLLVGIALIFLRDTLLLDESYAFFEREALALTEPLAERLEDEIEKLEVSKGRAVITLMIALVVSATIVYISTNMFTELPLPAMLILSAMLPTFSVAFYVSTSYKLKAFVRLLRKGYLVAYEKGSAAPELSVE